jgi:hypothetical protein
MRTISRVLPVLLFASATVVLGCQRSADSGRGEKRTTASPVSAAASLRTMIDDSDVRPGPDRFVYEGHWEHLTVRRDGRSLGTSSRSFHPGDRAVVWFRGTQIRLYGVVGPKGGYANVALDGNPQDERPDFYAPAIHPGVLLYVSPVLEQREHILAITVSGVRDTHGGGDYVNLDDAAVTSPGGAP